ncbi:hypothetical protein [Roseovarius sp. 2305UL8-3]|uniref:hypothetical protein n=1 Tax=Roseovarius conchicola TaxID=3121636 RepID=UPI003529B51C
MKQNFALTLSFDGIGLLHRAFPGWHLVGDVALDVADLNGELATMRQTAQALDASGLRTKVVLPNDQVRYLTIEAPDDGDDVVEAVKSALNGATPYPVDDLAYDFVAQNGQIFIAAVARETLVEAEAFATEHQFNPISFVAKPENGHFVGEPFFGATLNANGQGISTDQIERDMAPIRVIGASKLPAPEAPAETPDPEETETPAPAEADSVADETAEQVQPEPPEAPEQEAEPAVEDTPEEEEAADPNTPEVTDDTVEAASKDSTDDVVPEATDQAAEPAAQDTPDVETAEDASADDADPIEPKPSEDDETPPVITEDAPPKQATPDDAPAKDVTADADGPAEPPAAFASIRAKRDDAGPPPRKLQGVLRNDAPARITLRATQESPSDQQEPEQIAKVTGIAEASLPEDETDTLSHDIRPGTDIFAPEPEIAAAATGVVEDPLPDEMVSDPLPTEPASAEPESQASFFTRRSRRARPAAAPAPISDSANERERMTVFGAREKPSVGGKPRFLGLVLTAVLLLFLIGVAAWASIFLDDGIARFFRDDDTAAVASLPSTENTELDDEVELAALDPDATLPVLEDPATEILSRVMPSDLSPDEAKARYAATGIWQLSPEPPATPSASELEDVYQTSLDPDLDFQDAVALPEGAAGFSDVTFFTPASPPAADTTFTLDSRGFVLATPEGALTPDAVRVFAGQPAAVPPRATTPDDPADPTAEPQADTAEVAPQVAALRPRARPANAAEQIERNELSGRTRNELAALRPKLRPASAQEAAEEARQIAAARAAAAQAQAEASAAAQASTVDLAALEGAVAEAVAQPDPFAGATAQAVSASLKPNTRPRNFDGIVQRTKRNQQKAEAEQPVRVAAAQKVTPKIPTAASVSKQATQRNALKFKRVNLIGVYGTPNNRRALVRMNNGRYKKVKVGDRLDGGKVRAIGDGDLRYQKGGRTVVLTMPKG